MELILVGIMFNSGHTTTVSMVADKGFYNFVSMLNSSDDVKYFKTISTGGMKLLPEQFGFEPKSEHAWFKWVIEFVKNDITNLSIRNAVNFEE